MGGSHPKNQRWARRQELTGATAPVVLSRRNNWRCGEFKVLGERGAVNGNNVFFPSPAQALPFLRPSLKVIEFLLHTLVPCRVFEGVCVYLDPIAHLSLAGHVSGAPGHTWPVAARWALQLCARAIVGLRSCLPLSPLLSGFPWLLASSSSRPVWSP